MTALAPHPLLTKAWKAALIIRRGPGRTLTVRGPRSAGDLAEQVIARKAEILRYLENTELCRAGVPRCEIGNCIRCGARCHRYGDLGSPFCVPCQKESACTPPSTGRSRRTRDLQNPQVSAYTRPYTRHTTEEGAE